MTVKLWDVASGRELNTLAGHRHIVMSVAFSSDGRWLASGSMDKTVKVWDVVTGRELHTLAGHRGFVSSVVFSPDSHLLLSASEDHTVKLWDVMNGRELHTFSGRSYASSVVFSPNGRWLAVGSAAGSGSANNTIDVWDVASGRLLDTLKGHRENILAVAFSPDGRWLASASADKTIKLWDADSGRNLRTLSGHMNSPWSVAFSPDGRWLVSGGTDNAVKLWDVATGRELRSMDAGSAVFAVAFSPDGRWLASGSEDASIKLWEVASGYAIRSLGRQADTMSAVKFSPSGRWIAWTPGPDTLRLWQVNTGHTLSRHTGDAEQQPEVYSVAFSPDDRLLASGDQDNIKLWDLPSGHELRVFDEELAEGVSQGAVMSIAFSPDGRRLACAGLTGTIALYDPLTGRELRLMSNNAGQGDDTPAVWSVAFSPDGRSLVSGDANNNVKIFDVESGRELRTLSGHREAVRSVAFSPDGKWLASGSSDRTIKLWELASGRELRTLQGHIFGVSVVAFSPDGLWLASGSYGHDIKVWDLATGRELHTLQGHTDEVESVEFSPDGRWLISGSRDGTVRFWESKTGELAAIFVAVGEHDDWVVANPKGLFDGTERGMHLASWRIGDETFPPDRFFADYYTPGLLARILSGDHPEPRIDLASQKLPPKVRITAPISGARFQQRHVNVTVQATDRGGGVSEVRLYQNGKLVGSDAAPARSGESMFDLALVPGENILRATALSHEKVESNNDEAAVVFDAPAASKPVLHVLAIGINKYEDSALNLHFAQQDGQAIIDFFRDHGAPLFESVDLISLFDDDARRDNILKAFELLVRKSQPEDVVLIYLAGHGVSLEQRFYFLPHEMRSETDEDAAIRKYGIPETLIGDALHRIPALKEVLILDACQSEAALPVIAKLVGFREPSAAQIKAMKMLARSKGVYLIAASTKQQYAREVPELGHGVLTAALLAGLGEHGPPAALNSHQNAVTMLSLLTYINARVPELIEKYSGGEKQDPVSSSTGADFPLLVQ